jgi:hypothetical protein
MPEIDYSLNVSTLDSKARAAGHVAPNGELHLRGISRHTGIDIGVVSRIKHGRNRPDLTTVVALRAAYGGLLDDWVDVPSAVQAEAA